MLALVAERIGDRVGDLHLERERLAVLRRLAPGRDDGHLRRAPRQRGEPDVEARGRHVVDLDRQRARGQPAPAACGVGECRAAVLRVEDEARVAAAGAAVGREERLQPDREVGHRRVGERERARRADGGAGAAAGAQVRLDEHVVAVGADRGRRADVDALRAAGDLRAAVRAQRRLVAEELRLLELAGQAGESGHGLRLRERIRTRPEVALRRLVLPEPRRAVEVEHEVEALAARRVAAREVDRAGLPARGHARPVAAAAVEVDLVARVDRLLRARAHARIAARAQVEVDRVLLHPLRVERAEPSRERGQFAREHRVGPLGGQRTAGRAPGGEHGDRQPRRERVGPRERGVERTGDQHLPGRFVAYGRDGLRVRQRGRGDQRGDLGGRGGRLGGPAGGLADVEEADRLRPAALLGDVAQQPLLLRAGDQHVAAGAVRELRELALAQRRVHGHRRRQPERAPERGAVERHRAVAVADEEGLVGDGHRGCPRGVARITTPRPSYSLSPLAGRGSG